MAAQELLLELFREFEELSLVFVKELGAVTMEVGSTLEANIRKGQLEDAKIQEIKQLIKSNKTCEFSEDEQGTLWRGKLSYPVFMPKPSTHHMHDPGSNVPYIRPKVLTDNQMS
jgi:hypothetical protein